MSPGHVKHQAICCWVEPRICCSTRHPLAGQHPFRHSIMLHCTPKTNDHDSNKLIVPVMPPYRLYRCEAAAECTHCSAAVYSVLQGPSTPMVRPHPALWKLVHGCAVLYLVGLIYMLFQDAMDARLLLKVRSWAYTL